MTLLEGRGRSGAGAVAYLTEVRNGLPSSTTVPHRSMHEPESKFRFARVLYMLGLSFVAASALRPVPSLDVSDCFFLGSLIVAACTVVLTSARVDPAMPGLLILGCVVLCIGAAISLPASFYTLDAFGAAAKFVYTTVVWFSLGAIILRTRRHIEIAIAMWILSIAISGLAAIAQVLFGQGIFASFTTNEGPTLSIFLGRQIGFSLHPNDLGGSAAIVVAPAILFAASRIWSVRMRYVFGGLLCLVLACIALSGSVDAFVASVVSVLILSISRHVSFRQLVVVAVILAAGSISLVAINQQGASSVLSPADRVAQTLGLADPSLATGLSRLNLDAVAWDEIVRNPLSGVGLDPGSNAAGLQGVAVHNMFLLVWVGAGIFGFVGLLMMVVSLASTFAAEYKRSAARLERTLVLALGTSFLSFVVFGLAAPVLIIRYGWVPAALMLPLHAQRLRAERTARLVQLKGANHGLGSSDHN